MDTLQNARGLIEKALSPHFKGKTAEARLAKAVDDVIASVEHLISTERVPKNRLGVTVMTESASANKRVAPRNV